MKKILFFLVVLYSGLSHSQVITVNDTRTVDDLVKNVLLNSPCVNPTSIVGITGTNFGSSNGIGYFSNTNPAFPLLEGVILSTGAAINTPGPNNTRLSDGSGVWPGDTDLTTIFTTDPAFPANFVNATSIEFDFTSFSPNFSFKFLFASEEYGTFQCNSYDGIAILLTNGSVTENLALVPSTTSPISVETIRNELYNSQCPSANLPYFGAFNGGSAAAGSAINFNGQTVLLTASKTNLIPGQTYHLKIVIGDRNVTTDDSAIFIGGSSFDFGTDVLGPDETLCTNDGINESYTITSGLDPALFNFVWKDGNGNPIPGETGPDLTVNVADTYYLTYFIKSTNCEVATNDIVISYNAAFTTPNPEDLYKCSNGSSSYTYDLSYNTTAVDPNNQYTITYYNSQAEAQAGTPQQPVNFTTPTASLPKQMWMRIQDSNDCYVTKSFFLRLTPPPTATNPGNQTKCEAVAGSNSASFDLAALTNGILGLQSSTIYGVSYHLSQGGADTNSTGGIDTSTQYPTDPLINPTTIYIRVENKTDPSCFTTISFDLIVKSRPVIAIRPDQYVCVQYILPALPTGQEYWSGSNQTGTNWSAGTSININDTSVYIYAETGGTPNCPSQTSFKVFIINTNDITPADIVGCDTAAVPDYPLPGTKFYLDTAHTQEILPGTAITTLGDTIIYVEFTFTDPSCTPLASNFKITINKTPTISTTFSNLFDCTQINTLPVIVTDLGTANYYTYDEATTTYTPLSLPITTTTHVYAYAINNGCYSVVSDFMVYINTLGLTDVDLCSGTYTLTAPPIGEYRSEANGLGSIISTPVDITTTTPIYHYVPGSSCTNDDLFTITFHQPVLTSPEPVTTCETYLLPSNPYNPVVTGIRYFSLAGGPTASGNVEKFTGDIINSSTILYVYKESTTAPASLTPTCYNEVPWTININAKPIIDERGDQIVCFLYELTALTNGNYFEDPNGVNPIIDLTIDSNDLRAGIEQTTRIKTIYIYAANPNDVNCNNQSSFTITFDSIEAKAIGNQNVCDSYTLEDLPPNMLYYDTPMDSAHPELPHPGNIIAEGTVYNSTTVISPLYVYTETNNKLKCIDEKSFTITINNTPVLDATLPTAFNFCDTFTLPTLTVGKYYNQSITSLIGRVEIPITTYTSTNVPPVSIFVYAENTVNTKCYVEREIPIKLFNVTELTNVPATCESYQLDPTQLKTGENYYDSSGNLLASNAIINTPGINTILIRGTSTFSPSCIDETDFTVTIVDTPIANSAIMAPQCDTYQDGFDGIFEFKLKTVLDNQILGSQLPATDFTIQYFTSFADANDINSTPIPNADLDTYKNDNPFFDSVWARITNTTATNACFAVSNEIKLIVIAIPKPVLAPEYFICEDYATGTLYNSAILDTELSAANHSFVWSFEGQPYGGNTSSVTTNQVGNYSVTITNLTTTCTNTADTKVTKYAPYLEIEYSDAFENPTYIKVNVLGIGSGNYKYQLDNGNYQDSNIFYNVTPGEHTVSVIDLTGNCNPAPLTAVIINYPKYFTPNGDGYHETWNIKDLVLTNPNAPIFIFDRFGKLIKQITPTTNGWDGTYTDKPLPSDDYWFTVDYDEKGLRKTFKSHFSLKR
ncbi:MAG: choice-of-anchor L domain-containing protein [Bacteroidota bacterium]